MKSEIQFRVDSYVVYRREQHKRRRRVEGRIEHEGRDYCKKFIPGMVC